ncbi:MAG: hypothetical protein A2513_08925 [Sulfurimonas sp. RIFOXYD12_FULL_33_39]|uniref:hypothetical protein n=1 Tax=unclassified Sulfurimonas TaxID=2623549 RepID=UPI0008AC975F|nr:MULTISPECIES: hypothetical protein [unclassified Sulfurimonas]OHE02591.1 MAG: hypothetical protein A3G74_05345 [Sulfurimonas sp. RIFCSPLOWO2_12_FULL_34_6]OHE10204.1 MAG: hypothetical protein A2513_08925 [Sulfurimonas sp. RIFOXYD12_FULL_33_39]OHE14575.1 MAG: hypothetical protein A2530_01555 [Sulfurimonas sp. RIFOXYD2_FULL_34_21]
MNWLNFFDTKTELKHSFGRGINANLSKDEENLFNKSYEAFEAKDILNAYEYFFKSLENFSNSTSNKNIILSREIDKLNFEIFQGSARITGVITKENLQAEAIITKKSSANVALKRLLLERNYQLTYSYYFSDDEHIKLKLFHDNITMNTQKVFFPIREIVLNADFDKEYIKSEFLEIPIEDIEHLKPINDDEIRIKYDFLHSWIDEIRAKIASLPSNDNAGMQSFILLYLIFKMDYLIAPKYKIFQQSSKKVQEYFSDENLSVESKNEELSNYIDELGKIDFEEFKTNFYDAKYTFNPTEKASHEEIEIFITESLSKTRWYKNNRYNQIIPTMYKYIALYLLYNYGLHPVTKRLLHTLIEIQNPDFFKTLGYDTLYTKESSTFSKRAIVSKIEEIIAPYQNRYKLLKPFGDKLNFTSLNEFSNSFYLQLKNLNFEEI